MCQRMGGACRRRARWSQEYSTDILALERQCANVIDFFGQTAETIAEKAPTGSCYLCRDKES
jgi:hypothetical protein